MAITYVGVGPLAFSASAVAVILPGSLVSNDILILPLRTVSGQAATIPTPNGGTWTEVTGSPQDNAPEIRLTAFWSRYNGTQGNPTTNDSGTVNMGCILAFRGCVTTGDPWDVTEGNTQAATTAGSIPGDTTTVDGCMICAIAATDRDGSSTTNASAWANASLASIDERFDETTVTGVGGGFAIATGIKTVAGVVDATTWTQGASAALSNLMIALKPAVVATPSLLVPRARRMAGLIVR